KCYSPIVLSKVSIKDKETIKWKMNLEETTPLRLDCSSIPEFVCLKAKQELGETEIKIDKCLKEIRKLITNEAKLTSNTSDNFLLQFLRARKYITHEAFDLLKRYYQHRKTYASLYENYSPKQLRDVMDKNIMNFLPTRNSDGCAVWAVQFGKWDPEVTSFDDILRFGLLCNEQALKNPVTQISGVVSVVDLKELSWTHLFHIPSTSLRCYINATQDSLPIRHKAIHVINNPSIFAFLFAALKPLLNPKLKDRIHFHGSNLNSLHQFLPADTLPEEFGGTQGTFQNQKFYSSLLASEDEFIDCNKFGYKTK
ncbi:hypothetical protein JTE90_029036, partial [Oedothorax gibbosus]